MMRNQITTSANSTAASITSALVLFLISFGLHRGLDWLRDLIGITDIGFKLWGIGTLIVAILLPLWAAVHLIGLEPRKALNLMRPNWIRTAFVVPIGFGLAVAFNIAWPTIITPSPEYIEKMQMFIRYKDTTEFVLVFLLVVLTTPIADELLFRGFLLRACLVRYGGTAAVLLTALATALFHTWEPFKLGHAFVMGVIFATAVLWSRSIIASILLHALLNSLSLMPWLS